MNYDTFGCGDCGCEEGELHNYFPDCDHEICPLCKQQLLSCNCDKTKITDKIREPFFYSGFSCLRCGTFMPDLIMVSDEEWKFICGITYPLNCILCKKCMDFIKQRRLKNVKSNT